MALHFLESQLSAGGVDEYYYDDETGNLIVHSFTNNTALMEKNKISRDNTNGFNKTKTMREIADIDLVTCHRLLVEHNIDVNNPEDMPRLKAWLRERDNRGFVTCSGKF